MALCATTDYLNVCEFFAVVEFKGECKIVQ